MKLRIYNFLKLIPLLISFIIAFILFSFSVVTTIIFETTYTETPLTSYDNIIINIICITIFIFVYYKMLKKDFFKNFKIKKIRNIICIIILFLGLFLILNINTSPWYMSDQYISSYTAEQFLNKIYSSLDKGGYIYIYNHNLGFFSFLSLLYSIFGNNEYMTIKILNVISCAGLYYYVAGIYLTLSKNKNSLGLILISLCFFPILIYVTFIYNDLFGSFLSIMSTYYIISYLKNEKKINVILFLTSAIFSVIIRQNSLIFIISFVIILTIDLIFNKKNKNIIVLLFLIFGIVLSNLSIKLYYQKVSGYELNGGAPKELHIAMGMQWTTEKPGWWNGLTIYPYQEMDYDQIKTKEYANEIIFNELGKMKDSPKYALKFYKEKILSQFNDPTFECFDMTASFQEEPNFISNVLYYGKSHDMLVKYMDICQSIIYFGLMFYCLSKARRFNITLKETLLLTILVGGFLFQLIWEAKGRYVLPYFIVILPIGVLGIEYIVRKFKN